MSAVTKASVMRKLARQKKRRKNTYSVKSGKRLYVTDPGSSVTISRSPAKRVKRAAPHD